MLILSIVKNGAFYRISVVKFTCTTKAYAETNWSMVCQFGKGAVGGWKITMAQWCPHGSSFGISLGLGVHAKHAAYI